ncbi:nucleoside triphosphate pyrophosphohydrolase [Psychrosphaera ytuae]|uniref:Nucleoside triphosphate pyrophosphohydrolase n=1 Tax=Psychrosphaera ytuae TaxID=2820710 RepID=A0A975DDD5_9GAMM|nr:nucleoside triphosphate pyrophosphohydrolase [Psychrosphaera ytuae]QTH63595.1 nucleoside triphosphate pyrophosphohydrolase [Psychrosphaera ytuae]
MNWQQKLHLLERQSGVDKLLTIMSMLRDPENGCPWDLKQTFKTIVPHTLEEAYEVAEAIEQEDFAELPKELGDLLFQVVFYAQLGKEQERFDFEQIAQSMADKLIRRHPHVFGSLSDECLNESEIKYNWEAIKAQERAERKATSVLDDIPNALPALNRAYKIQKRAAHVGFDWPDVIGALDKVEEEIAELKEELRSRSESNDYKSNNSNITSAPQNQDAIAEELGDLFFALTNVSRHLGLNPEQVVRNANDKFSHRFRQVETLAEQQGGLEKLTLDEMETLWQQVKKAQSKA